MLGIASPEDVERLQACAPLHTDRRQQELEVARAEGRPYAPKCSVRLWLDWIPLSERELLAEALARILNDLARRCD